MSIKDSLAGRMPATAMRELLRQLERQSTAAPPARPNWPPPATAALSSTESAEQPSVTVGSWRLTEDPLSGDLVAIDADGQTHTLITRGDT